MKKNKTNKMELLMTTTEIAEIATPADRFARNWKFDEFSENKKIRHLSQLAVKFAHLEKIGYIDNPDQSKSNQKDIRIVGEIGLYHATADFRTIDVEELTRGLKTASSYQKFCSPIFSHEHVVSVKVIYKMLLKLKVRSVKNIFAMLVKYCIRATIKKEENKALDAAGLKSEMPEEFWTLTEGYEYLYENPFARYIVAGIYENLVINTRSF